MAMLEDTMFNKSLLLFSSKNTNFPESCNHDYILRTKLGYKTKHSEKCLSRERKFGVGVFMNVHVDIGRWSLICPWMSTSGGWVVKNGQNLVHMDCE